MKVLRYSELEFNLKDASDSIIDLATSDDKESAVGFDIGDSQTAVFEIRMLDDDEFYLKESLTADGETFVDESTEGDYSYYELQEMLTARIQTLDAVTEYPRLNSQKQTAIEKALAVLGLEKYSASQRRDRSGKWTVQGGGGAADEGSTGRSPRASSGGGGGTGPAIPTTDSQKKITQAIDPSGLAAGKKRLQSRADVLAVYAPKVKLMNPNYTIGEDGGAVYSFKNKELKDRPKNYPQDIPYNPRKQNPKVGDFSKGNEYKAFASKTEMMKWMNEGDLGAHKARTALAELYEHASKRQGADLNSRVYAQADNAKGNQPKSVNRFLEKNKLAGFDVDIHHMIPASLGGSNTGKNLVALTPKEHAIAHVLEWSTARDYAKNGTVIKQGKWGGKQNTFEATGNNIRANNIYRAITQQTTAAKRSGNAKAYFKSLSTDPSRRQANFALNKALKIAKSKKLLPSDNVNDLKLNSSGRPVWTAPNKNDVINILETA
jgi:hypothetical protein